MSSSEPSKWTTALGASADVNVIPATTPAGTGLASMSSLFPAITQVPIDAGGIAPERADFNALFKMLGDQSYFLQQGGVYSYSASYAYRAGDLVMYNGNLYRCIQAHAAGAAAPSNTAFWSAIASAGDIPTKTSQLQNDSGFITSASVPTKTSQLQNDSGFITASSLPTVNNGTLTIQQDGVTVGTFTANQAGNTTANIAISEIDSQSGSGDGGWVRFKSGIQIVFGAGTEGEIVNFPVAFVTLPRLQLTSPRAGNPGEYFVMTPGWIDRTTTYFTAVAYNVVDSRWETGGNFDYIAIGFWK